MKRNGKGFLVMLRSGVDSGLLRVGKGRVNGEFEWVFMKWCMGRV